jgi:hypothetical protein
MDLFYEMVLQGGDIEGFIARIQGAADESEDE